MIRRLKRLVVFALVLALTFFSCNTLAEEQFNCLENNSEMFASLLERKSGNTESTADEDEISLFGTHFSGMFYPMPSTGDVKVLVLPINFQDYKMTDDIVDILNEKYFGVTSEDLFDDVQLYQYYKLSVADMYKKNSFNQLRLSGCVLPVYTTDYNRDYYLDTARERTTSDLMRQEIVKAICSYKNIIGDLSEYDSNKDGNIDCLCVVCYLGPYNYPGAAGLLCGGGMLELYDGIKMATFVGTQGGSDQSYSTSATHEIGHNLGLLDNYSSNPNSN